MHYIKDSGVGLNRKHIKLCFTTLSFSDWVDDHKITSDEDSYAYQECAISTQLNIYSHQNKFKEQLLTSISQHYKHVIVASTKLFGLVF